MEKKIIMKDRMSFKDKSNIKHGLHGHVKVYRQNMKTGEISLWDEKDNIIPLSGYQEILIKLFGLYLDSPHNKDYEDISQDTTIAVPDLNESTVYGIGVDPADYSVMDDDVASDHFVKGFMIGNGGSGEDTVTTKNTDYTFMKLRNPIPFQQTQTALSSSIANNYLGKLRVGAGSFSKSYYIKKFDKRPHIYHSWYKDGQRWDYVDPVTQNDLGPNAVNGIGKTNHVESYISASLSLAEDDCISYFQHEGVSQTAAVNELGLVAFDTAYGSRSIITSAYDKWIKQFIKIVFDNNRSETAADQLIHLASYLMLIFDEHEITLYNQPNINSFVNMIDGVSTSTPETVNFTYLQEQLSAVTNIEVEACYNQNGEFIYESDKFMNYMSDAAFDELTNDEAQRIKLCTYYTFKTIPLVTNWRILIDYRIYTN